VRLKKIQRMWEDLKATPYPHLSDDLEFEFRLALLDYYITWIVEEFIASEGSLQPRILVLLRECKLTLTPQLKKLQGGTLRYFEQLLGLSREVLRQAKVQI
jgi:hypothetical protein